MALPIIPLLALCILITLALYTYLIYPAFLSPLSKIPNAHWSAPFSRLWILYHRSREEETPTIHALHQQHGPILRIAPNEISVNSVDGGIRSIYAGGYEKGTWYSNIFSNYGVMPMFAMPEHGPHSKRKRMLSNVYAKSTLQSSPALAEITRVLLEERLIPRLKQIAESGEPAEFYWLFSAVTMDFVSAYIFGLGQGTRYLLMPEMGAKFFKDYKARQRYQFWPQDLPKFTGFLKMVGLKWAVIPKWVDRANADIEAMVLGMCDEAEKVVSAAESGKREGEAEDWPTVYAQLRNALLKEQASKTGLEATSVEDLVQQQRLAVASEMLDHTLAGFDTSSITLTFFAWELSRPENVMWQAKLREEVGSLPDKHDPKALDSLPILHATLMETLRLHAAIPGNQPRVTPVSATLGPPGHSISDLPAGIRVQAQAWSLHREPSVFPDPESWNPDRWLLNGYESKEAFEVRQREMGKWFWAFGSGGRMCVGSNLAMWDMKAVVCAIWGGFETRVVEGDEGRGMVHRGGYVAEPVGVEGRFCVLDVREVGQGKDR